MMLEPLPKKRVAAVIGLSWLSMIGTDFLLHGGLMARFYIEPGGFLLPPEQAFNLIPLGYLSFLLLACLLVWLMRLLKLSGARQGLLFGLKLGAFVWGALVLGLLSITSADPYLLAGWFVGQTAELGIAGAFAGSAFSGTKLGRLFGAVILLIIACAVITIILQSTGLAPAIKRV
ncbi:MAG: hypothetical protein OEQ28_06880 [Acidobacteriota bacterium]|nr:hypothetical protein [Acidobacteriota bacterium]